MDQRSLSRKKRLEKKINNLNRSVDYLSRGSQSRSFNTSKNKKPLVNQKTSKVTSKNVSQVKTNKNETLKSKNVHNKDQSLTYRGGKEDNAKNIYENAKKVMNNPQKDSTHK